MHRKTFIAKLSEIQQNVDFLLSQLRASEHDIRGSSLPVAEGISLHLRSFRQRRNVTQPSEKGRRTCPYPSGESKKPVQVNCGATTDRSKRLFSTSLALLLPRIVRWVHVIEILGAYTMNLEDGFFASPDEVIGLGLDDYGATGG